MLGCADPAETLPVAARAPAVRSGGAPAFAAIDLGTNNCRLMIAIPAGGGFRVLDSYSRVVRLGEGLQHCGALSEPAMDRTLAALHTCAARIARRPLLKTRAVATEACRRAANGRSFLDRVLSETGLGIDIISSREEAELALESCASLLASLPEHGGMVPSRGLLFDIGGGSSEIAWVRLGSKQGAKSGPAPVHCQELIGYHSLPLGVITLAELFGERMFEPGGYDDMVDHVLLQLQGFEQIHCIAREIQRGSVRMLGTSGTVTTLASIALRLPRYRRSLVDGVSLSRCATQDAITHLRRGGLLGLSQQSCIGPERARYVLPGCAIFDAMQTLWPTEFVTVADRGLRDGMLLRMMRDAARPEIAHRTRSPSFGCAVRPGAGV